MTISERKKIERDNTMKISSRTMNYLPYILIVILTALLVWSMVSEHNQIAKISNLNQEKSTLVQELSNLKRDYQLVKSHEKDYEEQVLEDQDRIDRLIREVKFKSDDIDKYRTEISILQKKLENYLTRVDSLESTMEAKEQRSREQIRELTISRDRLASKIKQASRLNVYSLDIRVENKRGKRTVNPNRVDRVSICFTLGKNIFVNAGHKNLYLRIIRPDERLIYSSEEDIFMANGQELAYTGSAMVDYENVDTRVCFDWKNINMDLNEGLYYVNIYTDGYEIGSRSFLLDKRFLFF
jgi:hypothetical protein